MSEGIKMLEFIKRAVDCYDAFSDAVSEKDYEVFKYANSNVDGGTLLGQTYCKEGHVKDIIERLHGYLIAIERPTPNKGNDNE